MPKQIHSELSALGAKRLSAPGRHPVGTVPGLYLWVRDTGTKNWFASWPTQFHKTTAHRRSCCD